MVEDDRLVGKRPRSWEVTEGPQRAPARAMLRAVGFSEDDFAKAQVAEVLSIAAEQSAAADRMDDARYALRTALSMMKFEGNDKMVKKLSDYWNELEPGSPEAARWKQ